ncbi:MAG TPA: 50S ribosomal protein L23 [Candidatus Saccharimonadales bacterium]|nr:50S ribosomal protein L23 [Candidatus Saccharimonadales bacterium]
MHLLKPRLSEKAYATAQATNTFVIDVPTELNKHEVAAAVEKQFEVSVKTVRVVNRKGKTKRVMNITGKRYSNRKGVQSDLKKAYITLNAGSHLPFFEAEETEAKEAAKAADKAKKTEKAAPVAAKVTAKAENKTAHRGLLRSRKAGDK